MAAITSTALGVGMAGYQLYQGNKQKKDAENALKNYKRQDLDNAFQNVKISTVGSDLMREESQRTSADLVNNLRNAGSRSVLAGIPQIAAQNNSMNRQAQKYLDDQVVKREYAIAGDRVKTRDMQENREIGDLAGIGNAIQTGRQDMWNGIRGVGSSLMYGARNIDFGGGERDTAEPLNLPNSAPSTNNYSQPFAGNNPYVSPYFNPNQFPKNF